MTQNLPDVATFADATRADVANVERPRISFRRALQAIAVAAAFALCAPTGASALPSAGPTSVARSMAAASPVTQAAWRRGYHGYHGYGRHYGYHGYGRHYGYRRWRGGFYGLGPALGILGLGYGYGAPYYGCSPYYYAGGCGYSYGNYGWGYPGYYGGGWRGYHRGYGGFRRGGFHGGFRGGFHGGFHGGGGHRH